MLDQTNDQFQSESRRLGPNERHVLDVIRHHAPISRTDVSKITGLSAATIGRIAGRLLTDDVLIETGKIISGLGRPSILLEINATRGSVMAVEIGDDEITTAVADLNGRLVWQQTTGHEPGQDIYANVVRCINEGRDHVNGMGIPVAALTVGVPAIVDQERGVALIGIRPQWTRFQLLDQLQQDLDIPLIVDNDVNLAAIGHHWLGDATESDNFAIFSVGVGTGGAIVAGGQVTRGHHNAAGEFGCIVTDSRDVFQPPETNGGSLEKIVSEQGIVDLANSLLSTGNETSVLSRDGAINSAQIMQAALNGDSLANVVMDQVTRHLAVAIINVTAVAAPDLVIIDGTVGRQLEPFLGKLREAVERRLPNPPTVQVATKLTQATLFGAVAVGLEMAWSIELPERVMSTEGALIG